MTDNSNENTVDPNTDDLDQFNDLLFGNAKPLEDTPDAKPDEEIDLEDDAKEPIEEDSLAEEPDLEDDPPIEEEKPKKSRFQERIDNLTAKNRETERRYQADVAALRAEIEAIKAPRIEAPVQKESDGPSPNEKTEAGEDKYPLGEFDPNYIRDLTVYTVTKEAKKLEDSRKAEDAVKAAQNADNALKQEWQVKREKTLDVYEDFDEKVADLEDTFQHLDEGFGVYLAKTIMSMDAGTDVLYYLANNKEQAEAITRLDPARATLALGRLEAQFIKADKEPKQKVSNAPEPPPTQTRGNSAKLSVRPDTDDLAAFENVFYNKKGR